MKQKHERGMNSMNRAAVLAVLAEQLPDSTLEQLFPAYSPANVRAVLYGKEKLIEQIEPAQAQQKKLSGISTGSALSCRLFTDGASRGNPGEAGAGSVLLDTAGQELAVRSLYLGQCTNNVAEYKALRLGLQSALELGCSHLEIFLDSQLIVRQIQGQYKVKNAALKPLFLEVKQLLAGLQDWSVAHVPREQNKRADELANRGIDEKKG